MHQKKNNAKQKCNIYCFIFIIFFFHVSKKNKFLSHFFFVFGIVFYYMFYCRASLLVQQSYKQLSEKHKIIFFI